jgi:S-DNA-T family DNA segregation ATPase FtsK/SpoIIIE
MSSWLDDMTIFFGRYWQQLVAVVGVVAGAILLMTIYSGAELYPGVPVVSAGERLFGWTAQWVAVVLILAGVLSLMGERAGYWSIEALVGAELLLLALQVGSSVRLMEQPTWSPPSDGSGGGVVGWALGTLLLTGFGRTLTMVIVVGVGLVGILLLVRYTPLIYLLAAVVNGAGSLGRRMRRPATRADGAPAAGHASGVRFVAPAPPEDAPVGPLFGAPATSPVVTGSAPAAAPPSGDDANLPPFLRRQRKSAEGTPAHGAAQVSDAATAPAPPPAAKGRAARVPRSAPAVAAPQPSPLPPSPLPPLDLLKKDAGAYTQADAGILAQRIEEVLAEFGVPVNVVHVESGPTVTQVGVAPQFIERAGQRRKVRVSNIVALADDLALALATPSVRIEAPVPGRSYVGIEIPNVDKSLVALRGIMESAEMAKSGGALGLPLGANTSGAPVVLDLARAPHMLIAGATGSGKSVCINTIVMGLLFKHGPDSLRFIMVDPKRVELAGYAGIPHLMGQVITDVEKVMPALTWLTLQMDDRYSQFREVGVRNIDAYNAWVKAQPPGPSAPAPMPYLVLIVDELADLMMTAPEDVERLLCRLAQKARATGIHLILATQRPSVDVVTGLIKANFPTRIAFAVTSQIDSRVILDTPGAERLLGRGDMLLMRSDMAKLMRVQGCLVTDEEINKTVAFWRRQASLQAAAAERAAARAAEAEGLSVAAPLSAPGTRDPWADLVGRDESTDELVGDAIALLQGLNTCSVSMLQRKLRIGYPRAARLMQELEDQGIVGPDSGGSQGREVLLQSDSDGDSLTASETGALSYASDAPLTPS